MISDELYERLMRKAHQPKSLLQFFRESPLVGVELDLERDQNEGRDIELGPAPTRHQLHFRGRPRQTGTSG